MATHAHRPGDGSAVVACCDTNPERFDMCRQAFGPEVFTTTDRAELLKQGLDGIFITTPEACHEEDAAAALEAGIPIYLEKPMAITVEACDRILDTAERTGTPLFVGHNMRYMPLFMKMKALIDQGVIGEVRAIWCRHFISYGGDVFFRDWHADRKNVGSLLIEKGVHDIDLIHWLAGSTTSRVSAFGKLSVYGSLPRRGRGEAGGATWDVNHWPPETLSGFNPDMDVEDQTVMNMELANGVLASYMQCHFTPDACRNYTIIGDAGRMENMGDAPGDPILVWNRRHDGYRNLSDAVYFSDHPNHAGPDPDIVADYLRFLRGESTAAASPVEARNAVAAACRATEYLRSAAPGLDVPERKG